MTRYLSAILQVIESRTSIVTPNTYPIAILQVIESITSIVTLNTYPNVEQVQCFHRARVHADDPVTVIELET